ncbi:MAG: ATP-binding protein, partial [Alphaproteobacteria bacterium]|nr:ATP-binding protein [Alphaproteobacteria bacterium]
SISAPPKDVRQPATAEFRRVLQVLLNLVGNAIRYSPEGSTITIGLDSDGRKASVSVTDEGPGLDAEAQRIVFNKFERLGRSGSGGSGLGLYISKRLAQAMGGDLTIRSKPGEGATFTLTVPAGND